MDLNAQLRASFPQQNIGGGLINGVPRIPGESELAYRSRVEAMQWTQPPAAGSPQGWTEPNISFGTRQAAEGVGAALTDPQAGRGAVQTLFGQPAQVVHNALRDGTNAVLAPVANMFSYSGDTPQAQAQRAAALPKPVAAPNADPNAELMQLFQQAGMAPAAGVASAAPSPFVGGGANPFAGVLKQLETGKGSGIGAVSGAGALGPFQIMPKTGPEAAALAGEKWDEKRALTDPAYSAKLGTAYFGKQLQDFGGDPSLAFAAYNAGPGRTRAAVAKFGQGWLAHMPGETQQYVLNGTQQLSGQVGGSTYNPAFDQLALGEIDKSMQAGMTPVSQTYSRDPMPAAPKLFDAAPTDFSKVDADLAAMKPVDEYASEAAQRKVQWKSFFGGLGQALSSIPDGAGLGTVLARLGGGALSGRAAGMDELEKRHDAFQNRLEAWQRAVANNDLNKAQTAHSEAVASANNLNETAGRDYLATMQQWMKDNNPQFAGDRIVTTHKNADGTYTARSAPMSLAPLAAGALSKAQVFQGMGNSAQSAAAMQMQYRTYGALAMGAAAQSDPKSADTGAALFGTAGMRVGEALDAGVFSQPGANGKPVIPEEALQQLYKAADGFANQQVPLTQTGAGSEELRQQARRNYLVQQITSAAFQAAKGGDLSIMRHVLGVGSPGSIAHSTRQGEARAAAKTTVTQGRRGTSVSTTGEQIGF